METEAKDEAERRDTQTETTDGEPKEDIWKLKVVWNLRQMVKNPEERDMTAEKSK